MKDLLNKQLTRTYEMRAITPEMEKNRQAEFLISNESVDSYKTVFKSSGWELDAYRANPLVLYNHNRWSSDPDVIIGTSEIRQEGTDLIAVVTFESAEDNELADKVWRKVKNGTLRMASIGAIVEKGHYGDEKLGENPDVVYFTKQRLVEWSVVPFGSNPDAVKRNQESINDIETILKNTQTSDVFDENKLSTRACQVVINKNKLK